MDLPEPLDTFHTDLADWQGIRFLVGMCVCVCTGARNRDKLNFTETNVFT